MLNGIFIAYKYNGLLFFQENHWGKSKLHIFLYLIYNGKRDFG